MGENININLHLKQGKGEWKPFKTKEEIIMEEIEKALCNVGIDVNKTSKTSRTIHN